MRAFGGVGLFVREQVAKEFYIKILDKSYDGIMITECVHKLSRFRLVIVTTYLPPEFSKWGRDAISFFNHILTEMYNIGDCDFLIMAGDLNARVGKKDDFIKDVDMVKKRQILDENVNNHGSCLIDFLLFC